MRPYSYFSWNDSFLTDINIIDEQHKALVDSINKLGEIAVSADSVDFYEFVELVSFLHDYCKFHFSSEEEIMFGRGVDTRHSDFHVAAHKSFIDEINSIDVLGLEASMDKVMELVQYLINWLAYHILRVDKSLARQIKLIDKGISPEEAFDKEEARRLNENNEPLISALNGLFYALSRKNKELWALNRNLDLKIKERTTELEIANERLKLISETDELTGLSNRRSVMIAIDLLFNEAVRYGTELSVIMIDADHFKIVNDRFGHAVGDKVITHIAKKVRGNVRYSDVVSRLGGDEFMIVCPRLPRASACFVADKILKNIGPFYSENGDKCWNGSVSVGVASLTKGMLKASDLIDAADKALYMSKEKGRGCFSVFNADD